MTVQGCILELVVYLILYFAGPVIHPQYYSVQTPWGIYPANIIPAQGQQTPQGLQQMRGGSGRLTPSGQSDSGTPIQQQLPAQGLRVYK